MARIAGVNIPTEKCVNIALTYIYGIGPATAEKICTALKIKPSVRVHQLTDDEIFKKRLLEKYHVKNERELRREIENWSTYEEVMQYYHLVISNRLIKKIPEVPQKILEQGFLVETDNVIAGNNA